MVTMEIIIIKQILSSEPRVATVTNETLFIDPTGGTVDDGTNHGKLI